MTFWLNWLRQVRFYLLWRFVRKISVRPFLEVDENEYCPACGHRHGHIQAVSDGQQVQVRHFCEVCGYSWDVQTVVEIDPRTIIPLDLKEEGEEQPQKPARFVKVTRKGEDGPRVNGKELPENVSGIGDRKKPATVVL